VRVTAAAICGSTCTAARVIPTRGWVGARPRFVGVVEEVGPGARGVRRAAGDGAFQISAALLLLQPRADRRLREHQPGHRRRAGSTATRTPPAATTAAGRVRARAFVGVDAEPIPTTWTTSTRCRSRTPSPPVRRRRCAAARRRTVVVLGCGRWGVRDVVGVGDGRRRGDRRGPRAYRLDFARSWLGVEDAGLQGAGPGHGDQGHDRGPRRGRDVDAVGCEAAGSALHRALGSTASRGRLAQRPQPRRARHAQGGTISLIGAYGRRSTWWTSAPS
jgi:hypothetical protein